MTVDCEKLADEILKLLNDNVTERYRIAVMIVGFPGSGKSTIAAKIQSIINSRFQKYLKSRRNSLRISSNIKDLVIEADIPIASEDLLEEVRTGFFSHVEDVEFTPTKFTDDDGSTVIFGRGGLPNSIRVSTEALDTSSPIEVAQIVPMDGFHLSRAHLDHFKDPETAHRRRGAPETFDSNNYSQLCHLLAGSCKLKPRSISDTGDLMEVLCNTFEELPSIYYPGFDHTTKDPVRDQHCINGFTRILIFEGLYLMLNKENWAHVHKALSRSGPVLVYKIEVEEDILETRVSSRHLEAGIVDSIRDGVQKFRDNDLPNGRLSIAHAHEVENVTVIRND
ncbi:HGL047Cp [Eremothecium sinecaudum]|uniref:HGL047Cp n=1 Tax=Eremothecium sinecaudum TaxID=45286 RepID=A0A109V0F9_9SACH|nr:HGL047Cp [Eremothecium sinecaudum]AMD22293.1 HGL047Cp [Eremothecium sinecaudum]